MDSHKKEMTVLEILMIITGFLLVHVVCKVPTKELAAAHGALVGILAGSLVWEGILWIVLKFS